MIKQFLLIVLFYLQVGLILGQTSTYHPFPIANNAVWRVDYSETQCDQYHPTRRYQYTTGSDTTIGNFSYKKVYVSGMQLCGNIIYIESTYAGAIRNDSTNRKVYFCFPNYTDTLLYDFNLSVGDTMLGCRSFLNNAPTIYPYVITSIDSVLINSSYHKRFNTEHPFYSVIEGIGGTSGLLEPLIQFIDAGFYLTCFSSNLYNYPEDTSSCPLIGNTVGIKNVHFYEDVLVIMPNPINNEGIIELKGKSNIKKIEIYNFRGELLLSQTSLPSNTFKITQNQFSAGIYMVKLVSDSQQHFTAKFIIY